MNLNFDEVSLNKQSTFRTADGKGKLQDMTVLRTKSGKQNFVLIPYFAWDNREPGKMKVWIDFKE